MNGQRQHLSFSAHVGGAGALAMMLSLLSCVHYDPAWTPASVAPPRSFDVALQRVAEASTETDGAAPAPSVSPVPTNTVSTESAMGLGEAIQTALAQNRAIAVERFSPDISRTGISEARAAFDPAISASTSYGEQNTPANNQSSTTLRSILESISQSTATGDGTDQTTTGANAYQAYQQVTQAIDDYTASHIAHSKQFDASSTISTYLPTGTELYVSTGLTRDRSSGDSDPRYAGTWSIGVTQALLKGFGPAVNLVALRQAQNSAAISDYAFKDYVLDVVNQVESTYWSLALAQETLRIREFSLELTQEQLKLNEALIEVGKLAGSSLITAQAEVASQEADLVDARADLRDKNIQLWRLLDAGRDDSGTIEFGPIAVPAPPEDVADPSQSLRLAMMHRPDLAQARLNLANGQLAVVETKNGLLPRLDAFASYGRSSEGTRSSSWYDDFDSPNYDSFQVGLTFEWTIGNRAERARHTASKLRLNQSEESIRNLEQAIESDVLQAAVEVQRQRKRIDASHQEVLSREEELRVETDQFRQGRSTNLDVLQVQRDLIQSKVDEATARVGLMQATASLHRVEGTALARRGITTSTDMENER